MKYEDMKNSQVTVARRVGAGTVATRQRVDDLKKKTAGLAENRKTEERREALAEMGVAFGAVSGEVAVLFR